MVGNLLLSIHMNDGLKPSSEPTGTTVFLHRESWFSALRLIRLLIVLFICALVALVCWMVRARDLPTADAPVAQMK